MIKESILFITHGQFETGFIEQIALNVSREFELPVSFDECHSDISLFYNPSRRQYDGHKILMTINEKFSDESIIKIGLFRVDLFIPILTFIFGQAIFKGSTGIVSLYRLRNEQYGIKRDNDLLFERFNKVIIHEIGHTFGLIHCHVPGCIMRASTYVEGIDQKSHEFCRKCRQKLDLFR
jgi:archaemetzincin